MAVSIRLDTPGGSNFENYAVRNISQLSVGQAALPDAGNAFQVTGNVKVIGNIDANDVSTTLLEAIQDRVAAMFADSASIDATYDDVAGTISLAVIAEAVQDIVAGFLAEGTNVTLVYDDVTNTLAVNARNMTGATALAAGTSGAVPAPAAGDQDKALHGDGTFRAVSTTDAKVDVYDEGTLIGNAALDFTGAGVTVGALVAGRIPVDIPGGGGGGSSATTFVGVRAFVTADTSIPNATWTTIPLAGENFDSDGFHDTATNNSRLTIPTGKGGKYIIHAEPLLGSAVGQTYIRIIKNGNTTSPLVYRYASAAGRITAAVELVAGDYIELQVFQDSGAAVNIIGNASGTGSASAFELLFIGAPSPLQVFTGAKAHLSAAQSVANASWVAFGFNAESYDSDNFHDNATNNSRFTVPANRAGKYLINAQVFWALNTAGQRAIRVIKNGTTELAREQNEGQDAGDHVQGISVVAELAAGDYVEVHGYQDTGAALNAQAGVGATRCEVTYLGGAATITPVASGARVYQNTAQSMANVTVSKITLDAANFDTDGFFDNANDRLTIPAGKGGLYSISGALAFANNNTGQRISYLRVNGTIKVQALLAAADTGGFNSIIPPMQTLVRLAPGDYVELHGYQNNGATLNTVAGDSYTFLELAYLGA